MFCAVTYLTGMRPYKNTRPSCIFLVKPLALISYLLSTRLWLVVGGYIRKNNYELLRVLFSSIPYRYAPLQEHSSFLYFSRQIASANKLSFVHSPLVSSGRTHTEKQLRITSCFVRLHTFQVCALTRTLVLLVFFSSNRWR